MAFIQSAITQEQKIYSLKLIQSINFGKRTDSEFNGNSTRQFVGVLGEVVMADLLGVPRTTGNNGEFDYGVDFNVNGMVVDIKTTGRNGYLNRWAEFGLVAKQIENPEIKTDVYLMANINKRESVFELCGWIHKADIQRKVKGVEYTPKDTPVCTKDGRELFRYLEDNYVVKARVLEPIRSVHDFVIAMDRISPIV